MSGVSGIRNLETSVGLTARSLLMFSSFSGSLDLIHVHVHSLAALHHPSVHHRLHQGDDLCDHCWDATAMWDGRHASLNGLNIKACLPCFELVNGNREKERYIDIRSLMALKSPDPRSSSYLSSSPSSSLLYSAISSSRRVLRSSRMSYSCLVLLMLARIWDIWSSRLMTMFWRPLSCAEKRACVSARVPSREAFCWGEDTRQGGQTYVSLYQIGYEAFRGICRCWQTMLKWDCSSIWSLWRVLFNSLISVRDVTRVSVCVITSCSTAAT